MEEETEFQKLSVEDRVVHKLWKARLHGYEELTKLFRQIDDEKSPEFAKYLGLVKKFIIDSNVICQEKGLEATLAYVENYAHADRTVGEVMSGIVTKCLAAPKVKTRELATQLVLMYVEVERQEAVQDELLKGMDNKNPKTAAASVLVATLALTEFGPKVFGVKKLVKKLPVLLANRDKNVRDEAKGLVVEIFRWIGGALRSQLPKISAVQLTELEQEFAKHEGARVPTPTRYLRSQQQRQAKIAARAAETDEGDGDEVEESGAQPDIDPYELIDPVNVLAKLPADFYEALEAKKWLDRKKTLEILEELVKAPKLENGDYGDVVRALKKIISKDSNVIVVATSGKCLTGLATGLKKRFQPYAGACIPALLEKFREKKHNVVLALREALDAVFPSTTIEAILEDVVEALNNKNPSVKAETASFLARAFSKCQPTALNKKTLKAYTVALLKTLNEPDPTVRDNSAEALGTLMKLVSEKAIAPFLADVDNLKMPKIKECCDKAVVATVRAPARKERPNTAPVKAADAVPKSNSSAVAKPTKRSSSAAPVKRKPVPPVPTSGGGKLRGGRVARPPESVLSPEEVQERALDFLAADLMAGMSDGVWKTRLEAVTRYQEAVRVLDPGTQSVQVLIGVLSAKPGFKDTNIQVLKLKLETLKIIIEIHGITTVSADACINDITDKLGDTKTCQLANECLVAIADVLKLDYVVTAVLEYAFNQKSPKVQQEALLFVSNAIKEFGFNVNQKALLENAKKGVAAIQPTIRSAGITLLGTMYLYMGNVLHTIFENEKPALKQQITAEFDKHFNERPPEPIRGSPTDKGASNNSLDEIDEEEGEAESATGYNVQDLIPRIDISGQITEALINELADKNWKVRNEALSKVMTIITEAKSIHPNIGDLPQALALRLTDSNGKIAQTSLQICQNMASAIGPPCKQYVRVLFPGFLSGLSDNKNFIRAASITCMNTWGDICGYREFFEGEMIGDALKNGSPTLRIEMWAWLAEKLGKIAVKAIPKEELLVCIPILYTNLEDRNADVRKNVQECVLPFMIHLGFETMAKQTERVKPASKVVVMEVLEKTRPNLPLQPIPPPKKAAPGVKRKSAAPKVGPGGAAKANAAPKVRQSVAGVPVKAVANRKKEEDADLSPLLVVNNLKHQRVIDEQKLRVLKWNFSQPRGEFVELLKDQMSAAKLNKSLIANMFHADFRYHLKAIESLTDDLADNGPALVSNLDLILKWLSLRFFDTNPSVLLKGLEYLQLVFNMLVENNHKLLENEASSFIPYLILKVGDSKDAVRNDVRSLFNQIALVYPVSKLFSYIMEGLKSKNARQRTECLDELASLIGDYGICVCQPSPSVALKEVAKQIGDRDNSVRNAALNCLVQAFYIEGERIYKLVGKISDKDLSLLEERIKRASKNPRQSSSRASIMPPVNQPGPPPTVDTSPVLTREPSDIDNRDDDDVSPDVSPPPPVRPTVQPATTPGPFFLDPEILKQIEGSPVTIRRGPPPIDWEKIMKMLDEPIKYPDNYKGLKPSANTPFHIPGPSHPIRQIMSLPRLVPDLVLGNTCSQMCNADLRVAQRAIEEIDSVLRSPKARALLDYEDVFVRNVTIQLRNLLVQNGKDAYVLKLYRALLTVISGFYDTSLLGKNVTKKELKDLLEQLIILLSSNKFEHEENREAYVKVINQQCLNIIEYSDHTNVICALITLLHECVASKSAPRHIELVMKCMWREIKLIPDWSEDMDYDTIMYDVHLFFREFPSVFWKQQPSDYPIRTIKTILHSMAKIKGRNIMLNFSKIESSSESELQTYLLKLLKVLRLEEVKQIPLKKEKRTPLSRPMHTMLANIFEKIGEQETTKEGLTLLYEFRLQHPEADIESYLGKSSEFFQRYVQWGLKDIEDNRNKSDTAQCSKAMDSAP